MVGLKAHYLWVEIQLDIEDLSKQPPWGDKISPDIVSLANYFRTSDGANDVFDALLKVIQMATDRKYEIELKSL